MMETRYGIKGPNYAANTRARSLVSSNNNNNDNLRNQFRNQPRQDEIEIDGCGEEMMLDSKSSSSPNNNHLANDMTAESPRSRTMFDQANRADLLTSTCTSSSGGGYPSNQPSELNPSATKQQQQSMALNQDATDTSGAGSEVRAGIPQAKQHVGPMGIFFKVWSLVKVTKARHHNNKMRRQTSDDIGQLQFISGQPQISASGSSLALPSTRHHQASSANVAPNVALLNDGHFRRAGSQPAPSLHHSSIGSTGPGQIDGQLKMSTLNQYHLPVSSSSGANRINLQVAPTNSNSTSSGMSSTASSTTVASEHQASAFDSTAGSTSGRKDTNSARRQMFESSFGQQQQQLHQHLNLQQQQAQQVNSTNNKQPTSGWRSRIMARQSGPGTATSRQQQPQQQQLPMLPARYKQQSSNVKAPLLKQKQQLIKSSLASNFQWPRGRKTRAHSDANQTDDTDQLPRLWAARKAHILGNSGDDDEAATLSSSDDDGDNDDGEEDDDDNNDHDDDDFNNTRLIQHRENQDQEDQTGAESDTNDIYSTPNDSIQSVPNSASAYGPSSQLINGFSKGAAGLTKTDSQIGSSKFIFKQPYQQNKLKHHQQQQHPIVKSFSATNFAQLALIQAETNNNNNNTRCKTIDEQHENRHQHLVNKDEDNYDQPNNCCSDESHLKPNKTNGSRFFISSSSSEDSNPSNNVNNQQHLQHQHQQQSISKANADTNQLDRQNAKLPLHFGLHYHDPHLNPPEILLSTRPGTLIIKPTTRPTFIDLAPIVSSTAGTLNTPTSNVFALADPNAVAAVSPATGPPMGQMIGVLSGRVPLMCNYKKSPSLFEMSNNGGNNNYINNLNRTTRFSSRFPVQQTKKSSLALKSFQPTPHKDDNNADNNTNQSLQAITRNGVQQSNQVPNSISLQDYKLIQANNSSTAPQSNDCVEAKRSQDINNYRQLQQTIIDPNLDAQNSEYKLTQMLLESGSNPSAKDQYGCTALMHAVLSENMPALKCLIEHGVDLNDANNAGLCALDLVTCRAPSELRLEMLKLLIENKADLDRARESDGSRLLDRLIAEHGQLNLVGVNVDKMPFIDCLLYNGAKLGSSTWLAANGKHEIQLRLLQKLCQDGYFLYKKSSIEAAVYRFEYALRRIAELEQQLCQAKINSLVDINIIKATQQIKYQTYLGLSRCERKRGFYKRGLEFAHMSILVDSTSYEGYYSKAHILKDMGEIDESLLAIDQTARLVDKSIAAIKGELNNLQQQEESIVFDGCFNMHDPNNSCRIEANRNELIGNLDYLEDAKKHIARLRREILEDKKVSTTKP